MRCQSVLREKILIPLKHQTQVQGIGWGHLQSPRCTEDAELSFSARSEGHKLQDSCSAGVPAKARGVYLLAAVLLVQNHQTRDIREDLQWGSLYCTNAGVYGGCWCVLPEEEDKVELHLRTEPWARWRMAGMSCRDSKQPSVTSTLLWWVAADQLKRRPKFRMSSLPQSWWDEDTSHVENVVSYPVKHSWPVPLLNKPSSRFPRYSLSWFLIIVHYLPR